MPSKKQPRQKLDLTNLAALNTGVTSEPEKVTPEPEKKLEEQSTPEPEITLKEQPTPEPEEKLEAQPTLEPEKKLEEQPTPEPEEKLEAQPAPALVTPPVPPQKEPEPVPVTVEEAPVERRQFDKKPQRAEVRSLKTLDSTTNAAGESFKPGDKIHILAPWGKIAIAEITMIYQDESRNAWAQYIPLEDIPPNWNWFGGCARADLLVFAP